jgi:diguanylate cyclase (GGDEF)-like protein/PAS domain S-box-containing protein
MRLPGRSTPSAVPAADRAPRLWLGYLALGCVFTALYALVPPFAGNGPLINLLGLSSSLAIVVGVRLHRPSASAAWWLFVVGQFLFFAGDLYTYSYPKLLGAEVPFPSAGDALYLAVYPALMAGLLVLVRRRNPRGDRPGMIDSLILTVGVALLSWVFLIVPSLHLSGMSHFAQSVSIAYPLGDMLLLGAAIRLAVDTGKRAPAFYLLVGSIVALLTTDSIYTYALLSDTYTGQRSLDVGWILYYLLWGAAALHPSMRTLAQQARDRRGRLTRARLVLLTGACLIAPGVRFAQELDSPAVLVVIAASAVLFLLVVARMVGLVREEERAATLRSAGLELVGAASREHIHAAATKAARALVGAATDVRLIALGAPPTVDAGGQPRACSDAAAAWVSAVRGASLELAASGVPAAVRDDLELPPSGTVLVVPLLAREETHGLLVVHAPGILPAAAVESFEALAASVALALEGASFAEHRHRRKSEARFRSLVAHSTDLITVVDADGIVVFQSPSIERILGYRVEDVEGTPIERLVRDADRPRLAHIIAARGDGGRDGHVLECTFRHRDGTPRQFEIQHTDLLDDEDVQGIVLNARDVSERKAFEEQLAHQAFHDSVTALANRPLFADRVSHALARAAREGGTIALMFVDLDDFKTINDSLGHAAGDATLRHVAGRLERVVRPNDTVARFGGDEFAVLLERVSGLQEAVDVAERILGALGEPIAIDGKEVYAHASIGICLSEPGASTADADELLRNADVAMYMAKSKSKGGYRVFEPEMHARVLERLELRADLQRAIEADQLEVHFQPVVRLGAGDVYGLEALLRWTHPTRGPIPPAQFIPLAEETGLIIPMGRRVLEVACAEAASLRDLVPARQLAMSVNLSVRQLQSETIVADVRHALEASGVPAASLVLEITESVMMADTDLAVERLRELKALGVRVAMDDFGTGYSSLSYLSRFPIDILKMDRSFIAAGEADASLAAAIVGLGESLNLEVVAEGIELPEQISALRRLGCGLGQGFLFAHAMDRDALRAYLRRSADGALPDAA